jgi:molecular chaperone Hsp33
MAQFEGVTDAAEFRELVGAGNVTVTVEAADRVSRYQGVVPLAGQSLAESLEEYFERSEQIPSIVRLTATEQVVAGALVQRLPLAGGEPFDIDPPALEALWERLRAAVHLMPGDILLDRSAGIVARAAMADEDTRLFAAQPVSFECRCSPERVAALLRGLGESEVRAVLAEEGAVTVTCEFCHRPYRFDSIEVERLFASAEMAPGSDAIN